MKSTGYSATVVKFCFHTASTLCWKFKQHFWGWKGAKYNQFFGPIAQLVRAEDLKSRWPKTQKCHGHLPLGCMWVS